jgi:hypothetical protein
MKKQQLLPKKRLLPNRRQAIRDMTLTLLHRRQRGKTLSLWAKNLRKNYLKLTLMKNNAVLENNIRLKQESILLLKK